MRTVPTEAEGSWPREPETLRAYETILAQRERLTARRVAEQYRAKPRSLALFYEVKMREAGVADGTATPSIAKTSICMDILAELSWQLPGFERVLQALQTELATALYSDVMQVRGADVRPSPVPFFELIRQAERQCTEQAADAQEREAALKRRIAELESSERELQAAVVDLSAQLEAIRSRADRADQLLASTSSRLASVESRRTNDADATTRALRFLEQQNSVLKSDMNLMAERSRDLAALKRELDSLDEAFTEADPFEHDSDTILQLEDDLLELRNSLLSQYEADATQPGRDRIMRRLREVITELELLRQHMELFSAHTDERRCYNLTVPNFLAVAVSVSHDNAATFVQNEHGQLCRICKANVMLCPHSSETKATVRTRTSRAAVARRQAAAAAAAAGVAQVSSTSIAGLPTAAPAAGPSSLALPPQRVLVAQSSTGLIETASVTALQAAQSDALATQAPQPRVPITDVLIWHPPMPDVFPAPLPLPQIRAAYPATARYRTMWTLFRDRLSQLQLAVSKPRRCSGSFASTMLHAALQFNSSLEEALKEPIDRWGGGLLADLEHVLLLRYDGLPVIVVQVMYEVLMTLEEHHDKAPELELFARVLDRQLPVHTLYYTAAIKRVLAAGKRRVDSLEMVHQVLTQVYLSQRDSDNTLHQFTEYLRRSIGATAPTSELDKAVSIESLLSFFLHRIMAMTEVRHAEMLREITEREIDTRQPIDKHIFTGFMRKHAPQMLSRAQRLFESVRVQAADVPLQRRFQAAALAWVQIRQYVLETRDRKSVV